MFYMLCYYFIYLVLISCWGSACDWEVTLFLPYMCVCVCVWSVADVLWCKCCISRNVLCNDQRLCMHAWFHQESFWLISSSSLFFPPSPSICISLFLPPYPFPPSFSLPPFIPSFLLSLFFFPPFSLISFTCWFIPTHVRWYLYPSE